VAYGLEIMPAAVRELRALPQGLRARVDARIRPLVDHPRPPGVRRLWDSPFWRLRVGDYRVIYTIDDVSEIITIARVRHRRDVYRGL
jgi:mRNA interferase RelE/StbE